ncbi:MAG: hypothetical protein M1822_001373 [Bathelium mastoideum]|nr:MAG: hypothetical protein M1822_001373 [Bathelium mastoideum]
MAILPGLSGLKVTIQVGNRDACEYTDEESEGKNSSPPYVSKFIEAISGACFAVKLHLTSDFPYQSNDLKFGIYIDGEHLMQLTRNEKQDQGLVQYSKICIVEGQYQNQPEGRVFRHFVFSKLIVDEDAADTYQQPCDVAGLGEIVVKIWRVNVTESIMQHRSEQKPCKKASGPISEKALKGRALSHTTSLGDPVSIVKQAHQTTRTYRWVHIDDVETPLATFTFKYRSLDALKILRVIPRSSMPIPLDQPVENLSAEELRELVRRQKEQLKSQSMKTGIKRERSADSDGGDKLEMISSHPPKAGRVSRRRVDNTVDFVDLTLD